MRHFLEPASIAVVGASRREGCVGGAMLGNILRCGFEGPVYAVNPRAQTWPGSVLASVSDLPEVPELVVVATPADDVPDVARDCAMRGVRALLVLTAGFAEAGPEGAGAAGRARRDLPRRRHAARRTQLPWGDRAAPDALNATFAPHAAPAGRVGLLSQSGGVGLALMEQAAALGLGLSSFVSIGNRPDVSANDVLEYWEDDDSTDVVLLYLESFGNPRNFARIARRLSAASRSSRCTPGGPSVGARAAASHTGAAVAASGAGVDALLGQAGVVRVGDPAASCSTSPRCSRPSRSRGRRVAVVTNAGGPAILCADACEAGGLEVPEPSEELRARLAEHLPPMRRRATPSTCWPPPGRRSSRRCAHGARRLGRGRCRDRDLRARAGGRCRRGRRRRSRRGARRGPAGRVGHLRSRAPRRGRSAPPRFTYPEERRRAPWRAVAALAEWRRAAAPDDPRSSDVRRGEAAELLAAAVAEGGRWLRRRGSAAPA